MFKRLFYTFLLLLGITIMRVQAQDFVSSNLPIVVINTQGQTVLDEPKVNVQMGIIDNGAGNRNYYKNPSNGDQPDAFNGYEGTIGIEFRGSSSQGFPKKSYGFEARELNSAQSKKVSLLGMPEESDWILNATYNDKSLVRDVLTYHLSNQMGMYASRTKYVELVIDGEYRGIYILMEKLKRDANRINISSLKSTDNTGDALTGGYILKIDKSTGTPAGVWRSPYDPTPDRGLYIQVDYPKLSNLTNEQFEYIKNHVTNFETNLKSNEFKDPNNGYAKYIDVNTFVDYFLISEITHNPDAYRLSTFFYKDKDSKSAKLKMGPPWDYNNAYGNANYCNGWESNSWVFTTNKTYCIEDGSHVPFWWERLLEDRDFCLKVRDRWQQLRQTVWTYEHIETQINQNVAIVDEAQVRNFQRWPVLGQYVWPNYQWGDTYPDEVGLLKTWIQERLAWMDSNIPKIGALVCDNVPLPTVTTPIIYCQEQHSTPLNATGTALKWYANLTGGEGNTTSPSPSTASVGTTDYYVSQTLDGCESDRVKISVNINDKPSAPSVSNVVYTQGQTATPLTATGSSLKWYSAATGSEGSSLAPTPSANTIGTASYFVSQTLNNCESERSKIDVQVNAPSPTNTCIDIKVFLEGAMSGNSMHTKLHQNGLLPGEIPLSSLFTKTPPGHPYKGSPWNYTGTETVSSYNADVVDWVLISLRTAPQEPTTTIYRAAALLHQDGKVTTRSACPVLDPTKSYFVAVEHRNHIGAVSHDAVPIVNNKIVYDFTQSQSYIPPGLPGSGQLQVGAIFCLFASDANKASFSEINANDLSLWLLDNGKFGLYKQADFNLDGEINANDASIWRKNNGKFSGVQF